MGQKTPNQSSKILLAIQFWKGDQKLAMDLMRLIADLEPKHCDLADVLFAARLRLPAGPIGNRRGIP